MNEEQARLVLSTKLLSEEEKEQLLIRAQIIASEGELTAAKINDALASIGLTDAEKEHILTKLRVYEANTQTLISEKAITAEQLKEAIQTSALTTEQRQLLLSELGLDAANKKVAGSSKLVRQEMTKTLGTMAAWTAAIAAIIAIYAGVKKVAEYQEELNQKSKEYGSEIKTISRDIKDYQEKIDALKETLANEGASYSETVNARKDLLSLQDELIEKYGKEAGAIDIVTDAISNQKDTLEDLAKTEYDSKRNDYNKRGFFGTLSNIWNNALNNPNAKGMNFFQRLGFYALPGTTGSNTEQLVQSYINQSVSKASLQYPFMFGPQKDLYNSILSKYSFEGDAQEVADQLNRFIQELQDNNLSAYVDKASEAVNGLKDVLENKEFVNQIIYYDSIQGTDYNNNYKGIQNAYKNYSNAVVSYGDTSKEAQDALEIYNQVLEEGIQTSLQNGKSDIANYFKQLYPELQNQFNSWKFKLNFEIGNTPTVEEVISKLEKGTTKEDILTWGNYTQGTEQKELYDQLAIAARNYGIEIGNLIDILVEEGKISTESQNLLKQNLYESLFKPETTLNEKSAIKSWIENLIPEDIDLFENTPGLFDSFVENISKESGRIDISILNKVFDKVVDASNEAAKSITSKEGIISAFNDISEGFEEIDKIWKNVEEGGAFDFKLLDDKQFKENFSNLESYSDFVNTISDYPDDINKCKKAFNELTTEYLRNSGILNKVTEDTSELTSAMLKNMGVTNAQKIVEQAVVENKAKSIAATREWVNATFEEKVQLIELAEVSDETKAALYRLLFAEQNLSVDNIRTQAAQTNLLNLAEKAGITADAMIELKRAIDWFNDAYSEGDWDGVSQAQKQIDKILNDIQNYKPTADVSYDGPTPSSSGGSDKWLEEYKDKMSQLKDMRERDLISGREYYEESEKLMNQYLKDTPEHIKKYATEISEAEKDIQTGLTQLFEQVVSDLNSDLDNLQSAFSSIADAIDEYNQSGALSIDTVQSLLQLEPKYLSMLFDETGALKLDKEAYEKLARAKMEEMKVGLAMQMADTINNLTTEAQAVQYLTSVNRELIGTNLSLAESYLEAAVAAAKLRSEQTGIAAFGEAAEMAKQVYENQKTLIDMTDYSFSSLSGGNNTEYDRLVKELEHRYKMEEINSREYYERLLELAEQYYGKDSDEYREAEENLYNFLENIDIKDWIEVKLDKISSKIEKAIDNIEKFYNWQKKNLQINKSVSKINNNIGNYQKAYKYYMAQANSVGLDPEYIKRIQNGDWLLEEMDTPKIQRKIEKYQEWYDKAESVREKIEDLYDQERELIRQKLDNVLDYYSDLDSYLSSITSKIDSLVSLNESMGKKSSLADLVDQFASLNKQLNTTITIEEQINSVVKTQIATGLADSVKDAMEKDRKEAEDALSDEIAKRTNVVGTGTYQKLMSDIAKQEAKIQKMEDDSTRILTSEYDKDTNTFTALPDYLLVWDSKKYKDAVQKLQNYYSLKEALENNATADTVASYQKIYNNWIKLQNKIDSGEELTEPQRKNYEKYQAQMDALTAQGKGEIDKLSQELLEVRGEVNQSEIDKLNQAKESIQEDLKNSATYQNLEKSITDTKDKLAKLDAIGYDNLTKSQKKTYDKLTSQLEGYYDQRKALEKGATAETVVQYNKTYLALKKLQDKIDAGGNLSVAQWKQYNNYQKQLQTLLESKNAQFDAIDKQIEAVQNPGDKLTDIKREYEEASKQMYDSYQDQIDVINDEVKATEQYKNILANIQKLEQKQKTKGLTADEEKNLYKYRKELEALEKGGTGSNISEYIKIWEAFYKLQQKKDSGKTLSPTEATNYDTYKAMLDAWNNEKQEQISLLESQREDALNELNKSFEENTAEAKQEINERYAKLYELAKKIAEYNIDQLETQLELVQSMISYYSQLTELYDKFSGNKLNNLLTDLGFMDSEGKALSQLQAYEAELVMLNDQYDLTKKKLAEYQQLLNALDTDDFAASMDLFNAVLNDPNTSALTKKNLQEVIDLLNKRSIDANSWGQYADEWENEWLKAIDATKESLIDVAGSIQDVNDAIRELSLKGITNAIKDLERLQNVLSGVSGLIDDEWLFDDNGELTDFGVAKVTMLVEQMNQARNEASKYAEQVQKIQEMESTFSSEEAYQEALAGARESYLSALSDLKGFEDQVASIMTQNNEKIIESIKELIANRIKALQAQKDLYEYNKTISNSQKEIDNIEAQIAAMESLTNATDAATKAKLAQLKAELEEKKEALQETKDDHTYTLQIDALNELSENLEDMLSTTSDAINEAYGKYIDAINAALEVYENNNQYLDKWSSDIIDVITGISGGDGNKGIALNVNPDDVEYGKNGISMSVKDNETSETIKNTSEKTNAILTSIDNKLVDTGTGSIFVKIDPSQLYPTWNTNVMNFSAINTAVKPLETMVAQMNQSMEAMAGNVARMADTTINLHYDSMIRVDGNIDKDFTKQFKQYTEQASDYIKKDIYKEIINMDRKLGVMPKRTLPKL